MDTKCITCLYNKEGICNVKKCVKPDSARKDDDGKARYDLIPPEALEILAALYATGAKKYDARNWEKGMDWSRCYAAMMRHAWAWMRGENYDRQDGQHHMASVAWYAFTLLTYASRGKGNDDRPKGCATREALKPFVEGGRA